MKRTNSVATGDTGAPAALRAIEAHELKCREAVPVAEKAWHEAESKIVDEDEISLQRERRLRIAYIKALEMWHESTKKLAVFDKGVAAERREGEKILVSDAKEMFAQYNLSIDLAVEAYIVSVAQQAALCDSAESFHVAHAEAIRAAKAGAFEAARRDGVLLGWIV